MQTLSASQARQATLLVCRLHLSGRIACGTYVDDLQASRYLPHIPSTPYLPQHASTILHKAEGCRVVASKASLPIKPLMALFKPLEEPEVQAQAGCYLA